MPLPPAGRVPGDELTFQSRPDLSPASVEITKQDPEPDGDDIFITPQQGPTQNGAMILNSGGQMVWFQPVASGDMAADLRVQHYRGEPVLTWWQGYSGAGVGAGEDVIEDSSYRQIAVVKAANGLSADLHELPPPDATGHGADHRVLPGDLGRLGRARLDPPDRARLGRGASRVA